MSKQLHILFLASWYPNRNQPVLGNFIAQHAIAAGINHKVSVAAAFGVNIDPELQETHSGNVSEFVMHYGKVNGSVPIINSIRKAKAYKSALQQAVDKAIQKNGKPDIIHVHVAWPVAIAALAVAEELNVPVVLTEHWSGYLPEDGNYRGAVLKHYTRKLFSSAKVVTVVSEHMKLAMLHHGLHANFRRLANAVDTTVFQYAVPTVNRNSVPQFLHVSMLVDREKNITGLLAGFAEALGNRPMHLTIAGDGPERTQHEKTVATLGIGSSVTFAGLNTAEQIAVLMNKADALVMFSNFEGMPVTIIEAKCCGLPVIATSTGAIPEMLTDETDQLISPGATAELTSAFIKTADTVMNDRMKNHRENISVQATAKYSLQAVSLQLDSIYAEVLNK